MENVAYELKNDLSLALTFEKHFGHGSLIIDPHNG